ncbi:hypothetical protein EDB92DRAFT_1899100 [Lactarius akahatsu]|uniref:Uncharacterized protein n=1 Tax=Lactarius akahatsu TaxID=416441 RepID=A0AAD4L9I5_9AGAM|nr:hypothetical protein EDB92DRAFT_1899100 [Lactarius akahatsu]
MPVMSLTPHFDPLTSLKLQLFPTPSPAPRHRRNSSSSELSSRCPVKPATGPHPQKNIPAAQGATVYQQHKVLRPPKKLRSRLTGLATPFHVDIRPPTRCKTKLQRRTPNVDTVLGNKPANYKPMFRREFWGDAAGSARPDLLTPDIPTSASPLESYIAATTPSHRQSQPGGSEGPLRVFDGHPSSPIRFPVQGEPFSAWARPSNYGVCAVTLATKYFRDVRLLPTQVASKEGPTPIGYRQCNDVDIHEWYGISHTSLTSEHLDEHLSGPVESDNGMADLIGNSWDNDSSGGDINMQRSDAEGDDNPGETSDANVMITEGGDKAYDSGDSDGSSRCGDGNANSENGDSTNDNSTGDNGSAPNISERSSTEDGETDGAQTTGRSSPASSQETISRKRLLSFLARDIKCIRKQPQDAPCTKGDIQMMLDHLHRVVKLEENQTIHKKTRSRSTRPSIPDKRKVPSLPTDHRKRANMTMKAHLKMKNCQYESEDPVAYLKVQIMTSSREKKNKRRGKESG